MKKITLLTFSFLAVLGLGILIPSFSPPAAGQGSNYGAGQIKTGTTNRGAYYSSATGISSGTGVTYSGGALTSSASGGIRRSLGLGG